MTPKQRKKQDDEITKAYASHSAGMNSYAYFKMQDKALGKDLVQDTFVKTWAYLVRGGKIDIMRAFLYHVLNHLIIDEYRKHKPVSLDLLLDKGYTPNSGVGEKLADMLDGKAALLLISRLPIAYQKVMRMRYVQNLSLDEMSLITGQTKNTIAVQAYRGLAKLKELYNAG
jgi:RNA polymerase sigma-70 factor, ECF subfamily